MYDQPPNHLPFITSNTTHKLYSQNAINVRRFIELNILCYKYIHCPLIHFARQRWGSYKASIEENWSTARKA